MASLNKILGTLPSGAERELTDDQLTQHLRDNYIENQDEKKRKDKTRKRVELYKDRGEPYFAEMIDDKFKNLKNRTQRKKFIEIAMYQNLTRRIVREVSTVYAEPAKRIVESEGMREVYKELQTSMRMDRRMRLANRMVNLCNSAVIWFDIVDTKPLLRVVTPDNFWAVHHPNDPTQLVALIFDQAGRVEYTAKTPRYLVMGDEDTFALNENGRLIEKTRKPHGLTRMPALLVHREEPDTCLLDPDPGKDITSAHEALALMNIMLLKHQKSGTKQAVAAGDLADMPYGQQMDEEHVFNAPEGVVMSTLDLGANPESYIKTARSIIKQIAANYGIPESVFDLSYQATSGFEIELKRSSLKEIRRDQILDWRPVETELANLMVEALVEAKHPLAFNTIGWAIDFGETGVPQEPIERLRYWKELRTMGLMNTEDMYMYLNPEATRAQARSAIAFNAMVEAQRVEVFRALNMSPDTPADGADRDEDEPEDDKEDREEGGMIQ